MKNILFAVILLISALAPNADAAEQTALTVVQNGMTAYLKDGPEAAIKAWLKGSGMEGNTQALTQANSLRQIEDFYGKPESYDVISDTKLSPRSRMILFTVNHHKGIVFGRFQVYQTKSGSWVATEFKFHTDAAMLLPASMLYSN